MKKIRHCVVCDSQIKNFRHKYCSDKCSSKAFYRRNRPVKESKVKVRILRQCSVCKTAYQGRLKYYCSQACRQRAFRDRPQLSFDKYLRNRWLAKQRDAKRKEVSFNLTISDIEKIIKSQCFYCMEAPSPYSEIDRKVPKDGYVVGNCVPACHRCNTLKSNVIDWQDMVKVAELLWRN